MKSRIYAQGLLLLVLLTLDQGTKAWIEQQPYFFHQVVLDGFFDLVQAHNAGVAFSMFADWESQWRTGLLLLVTAGIAAVVGMWWWKEVRQVGVMSWLLVLILAGAVGNIWDRLTLGYVVDFIDWHITWSGAVYHWPAFNIADSCISIAVVGLLLLNLKDDKGAKDV